MGKDQLSQITAFVLFAIIKPMPAFNWFSRYCANIISPTISRLNCLFRLYRPRDKKVGIPISDEMKSVPGGGTDVKISFNLCFVLNFLIVSSGPSDG